DRYGADFEKVRGSGWQPGAGGGPQFDGLDMEQIFRQQAGRGGGGPQFDFGSGGFGDFFEQILGGGGGRGPTQRAGTAPPQPGANLRHELNIPLQLAVTGGKTEFYVEGEKLSIKIPAGIKQGGKMRLKGKGKPSPNGGATGDLIVQVNVLPHPHFKRLGNNLELTLPVRLDEAALGAKVDVPTANGTITLTIPPCSSGGRKLRLKGQGVQSSPPGDLIVRLQIQLPESLDESSQSLLRQFAESNADDQPRQDLRW
ncbi:MAG: J domain-containing protein, partial [Planctomycetota bacterium]